MGRGYLIFIVLAGGFASLFGNGVSRAPSSSADAFAQRAREAKLLESGGYRVTSDSSGSSAVEQDGTIALERSSDGHFYADVQINGASVRALVDTGASSIALSREDARAAGLAVSIGMDEVVGKGADGDVRGEYVKLDKVTLGHKTAEGMSAIVLNAGEQSLLGQSFLSKFDSVEIERDRMLLR
jgi:aspartyl protease family protein